MKSPHCSSDELLDARVPRHRDEFVAVVPERCNTIVHLDQLYNVDKNIVVN